MRKLSIIYWLTLLSFIFLACAGEKDDGLFQPVAEDFISDQPVFKFTASSEQYRIQAGVNDFYMFTEYEFVDNLHTFISRFSKLSSCDVACEESLVIRIKDFQTVESSAQVAIDQSIQTGEYSFSAGASLSLSEVSIEYTNVNGITYYSDQAAQDASNIFTIHSIEDFADNENGNPTKKLTVSFDCELANETNNDPFISFRNATAVIGIAYPE